MEIMGVNLGDYFKTEIKKFRGSAMLITLK